MSAIASDEVARLITTIAAGLLLIVVGGIIVLGIRSSSSAQTCAISTFASQKITLVGEEHFGVNCPKDFPIEITLKDIQATPKFTEEQRLKEIYAEKMRSCWSKITRFLYPGKKSFRKNVFQESICVVCSELTATANVGKKFNYEVTGFSDFLQNTAMQGDDKTYFDYLYNDYAKEIQNYKFQTEWVLDNENIDTINLKKKHIVMFVKEGNSDEMAVKLLEIGKTTKSCYGKRLFNQPPVSLS